MLNVIQHCHQNFYGISLYRMSISSENKVNALFVILIAETKPLFKAVNIANIGSPFHFVTYPYIIPEVYLSHHTL